MADHEDDLDSEKGAQQVGPDKPPRDGGPSRSDTHEPAHGAKSPDSEVDPSGREEYQD